MPVVPFFQHDHREREVLHESSDFVLGAIHKLLTRKEMLNSPDALKAIKEEAVAMRDTKVCDGSTVIEKDKLLSQARAKGSTIHLAELMSICSIKFFGWYRRKGVIKAASCSGGIRYGTNGGSRQIRVDVQYPYQRSGDQHSDPVRFDEETRAPRGGCH